MLGGRVCREEKVPRKEHEVHEGPELDRPTVADGLSVFAGPQTDVEADSDWVGDMVVSGVVGGSCHGNNGVQDYQRGGLFLLDRGVFEPVDLKLLCEALVEPSVCLRVRWFSRIGQTI